MSALSQDQVRELSEVREIPCLSIYLPTFRAGAETVQNQIRFKNLLRRAEERLGEQGLRAPERDAFLAPARDLAGDADFWQHQEEGLALFRSRELFRSFRLPASFDERVVVDERFHLKPLFRLLGANGHFYILALSRNRVRLLAADRDSVRELALGAVPASMVEALGEEEVQKTDRGNTFGPAAKSRAGSPAGLVHHGHGAGDHDIKEDVRRFFNLVDDALPTLDLDRNAPLVLAGVEYELPIYREISRWTNVVEQGVTGNPDLLRPEELHEQALRIVAPMFERGLEEAIERYGTLAPRGRASSRVEEVVPAAHDGRIDTLFTARGAHLWGSYDPQSREVRNGGGGERDGKEDLLDLAAVQTLLHGGAVFSVDPAKVPASGQPLAAIFRY